MTADLGSTPVRTVQRALQLLAGFDEDCPLMSVRDLTERTGLPKTTVLRLLQALERQGFVFVRADGRYSLGPIFLRLGRAVDRAWRLPLVADATMELLRDRTGETVNLYVVEGLSRVCVAQKQSLQHVRYVVPIGVPLPLWAGASGKVLLAERPPAFVEVVLASANKDETFRRGLEAELARVRSTHCGVSHGERESGASSVAVPIHGGPGGATAALAISGPTARFSPEAVDAFARLLLEAVAQDEIAFAGAFDSRH